MKEILDITKKGNIVTDRDAAYVKIDNALSVMRNEIPFRRHLGSTLEEYLFMPFTFSTSKLLIQAVKRELPLNCKGYQVLPSSTIELDEENRTYNILLYVSVEGLQDIVEYATSYKYKG